MDIIPQLYTAKVMHKRLFPKENAFSYGLYYLALPLPASPIPGWLTSFSQRDLGKRDGSDPGLWAKEILASYGMAELVSDIVAITMPRVLGYIFNPVSFYLCLDDARQLRAVICEVHNTFGEQHSYLCAHHDHTIITGNSWLEAEKLFHVSPFLARTGHYRFRFDMQGEKLSIWIDYYDHENRKQLITSLSGSFSPLTKETLKQAFWRHPLVTLKAITLIHWQALKLVLKAIKYIPKPAQQQENVTSTRHLTKM